MDIRLAVASNQVQQNNAGNHTYQAKDAHLPVVQPRHLLEGKSHTIRPEKRKNTFDHQNQRQRGQQIMHHDAEIRGKLHILQSSTPASLPVRSFLTGNQGAFCGALKYLKNSESGSRTRISLLLLKLSR